MMVAGYSNISGIVSVKSGFENISTYSLTELRAMLDKMGADNVDEVRIASLPHTEGGNFILLKPHYNDTGNWIAISPILHPSTGPLQTSIESMDAI